MNEIKYREATKQDIPKIIELWKEFIDFHKVRDPLFSRSKEGPENFGRFILDNLSKEDAIVYVAEKKWKGDRPYPRYDSKVSSCL